MTDTHAGDIVLSLRGVTKRFGSATALDGASFQLRRGTLHALLGENGAGKTTLMRVVFGLVAPDDGTILLDGEPRRVASPRDAARAGIGMVHQHFTLAPALTVTENIALGGRGMFDSRTMRDAVLADAARIGLPIDPDARVGDLPIGAQQRVEILKALRRDARILILDEPTAVLTPTEARELLARTVEFVHAGGSAVLITHKLRDAMAYADDITVMRRGRTVWTGSRADTTESALVHAMVGEPIAPLQPTSTARPQQLDRVILRLDHVTVRDTDGRARLRDATLEVHGGEILGVAAVEGNGAAELVRVLAGVVNASEGNVTRPVDVGFVPEDRFRDALVREFTITENIALHAAGTRGGRVAWSRFRDEADRVVADFDVRTTGRDAHAGTLSGGNAQKLVVGRELRAGDGEARAIVVENPSRGLDVRAGAAVHAALRDARDAGAAVVVYSSDLDEVRALADRIVVVHDGTITEVSRTTDIGAMLVGVTAMEST